MTSSSILRTSMTVSLPGSLTAVMIPTSLTPFPTRSAATLTLWQLWHPQRGLQHPRSTTSSRMTSTARKCFDKGFRNMLEEDGTLEEWDEEYPGIPQFGDKDPHWLEEDEQERELLKSNKNELNCNIFGYYIWSVIYILRGNKLYYLKWLVRAVQRRQEGALTHILAIIGKTWGSHPPPIVQFF